MEIKGQEYTGRIYLLTGFCTGISYRREGDSRVERRDCSIKLNYDAQEWTADSEVALTYGEPFTIQVFTYHERVWLSGWCEGHLYRIGD